MTKIMYRSSVIERLESGGGIIMDNKPENPFESSEARDGLKPSWYDFSDISTTLAASSYYFYMAKNVSSMNIGLCLDKANKDNLSHINLLPDLSLLTAGGSKYFGGILIPNGTYKGLPMYRIAKESRVGTDYKLNLKKETVYKFSGVFGEYPGQTTSNTVTVSLSIYKINKKTRQSTSVCSNYGFNGFSNYFDTGSDFDDFDYYIYAASVSSENVGINIVMDNMQLIEVPGRHLVQQSTSKRPIVMYDHNVYRYSNPIDTSDIRAAYRYFSNTAVYPNNIPKKASITCDLGALDFSVLEGVSTGEGDEFHVLKTQPVVNTFKYHVSCLVKITNPVKNMMRIRLQGSYYELFDFTYNLDTQTCKAGYSSSGKNLWDINTAKVSIESVGNGVFRCYGYVESIYKDTHTIAGCTAYMGIYTKGESYWSSPESSGAIGYIRDLSCIQDLEGRSYKSFEVSKDVTKSSAYMNFALFDGIDDSLTFLRSSHNDAYKNAKRISVICTSNKLNNNSIKTVWSLGDLRLDTTKATGKDARGKFNTVSGSVSIETPHKEEPTIAITRTTADLNTNLLSTKTQDSVTSGELDGISPFNDTSVFKIGSDKDDLQKYNGRMYLFSILADESEEFEDKVEEFFTRKYGAGR